MRTIASDVYITYASDAGHSNAFYVLNSQFAVLILHGVVIQELHGD